MPELITKVSSDGFENRHIFFVGFSMGAGLSLLTAGRLPFQVGGVVAISGFIKNRELFTSKMTKQSLGTPILILHGNHDKLVLPRKAEETVDFLKNLGYSVRYQTYDAGHKVPNEVMHIINSFIEDGTELLPDGRAELKCLPEVEATFYEQRETLIISEYFDRLTAKYKVMIGEYPGAQRIDDEDLVKFLDTVPSANAKLMGIGSHFLPLEHPRIVLEEIESFFSSTNRNPNRSKIKS